MATTIQTSTARFGSHPPQQVSVRTNWSDSWTPVQFLYCDRLTAAASPTVPQAQLVYRYGEGLQPGETTFAEYTRQDLVGKYVKVEVAGLGIWYGIVLDTDDERWGAKIGQDDEGNETRDPRGVERFLAVGLEDLLDRVTIRESVVADGSGGTKTIGRAIPFNAGSDGEVRKPAAGANADDEEHQVDEEDETQGKTWVFTDSFLAADARTWNARRIIQYLLGRFSPVDESDNQDVPFQLDDNPNTSLTESLEWHEPTLQYESLTLKEILDLLIDRRRGLGWHLVVDEGQNRILIRVFSHFKTSISLSSVSMPANLNQATLDFDDAVNILRSDVRSSRLHQVDQILVRGARRGAVCTLSFADGTLDPDWSTATGAEEEQYEKGASEAADYEDLSDVEKRRRNEAVRRQDSLQRVYSWFTIDTNWDGKVGDGEGGTKRVAIPVLDDDGFATADSIPFWRPGLRFAPELPLLSDHDYTTTTITRKEDPPDGSNATPMPPIVLIQNFPDTDRYVHVERLSQEKNDSGDEGRDWSCSVSVDDRAPRLILDVEGADQHYLAKNDFTPLTIEDEDENDGGKLWRPNRALDYHDLIATVYLIGDAHVEKVYPDDASVTATDVKRVLQIEVPDAHLDNLPANTVVGVEDGELQKASENWVRDDRDRLADIARTAWEFYGTERNILDLAYRGLEGAFQAGMLVTEIGSGDTQESINTVITFVEYDLLRGVTALRTDFAELDPSIFV